jgi:hypothetical protein
MGNYREIPLEHFLLKIRKSVSFLKNPKINSMSADEIQKRGLNKPYLALGPAGCGKSESIANLCAEMHIGYREIRLVTATETDLMGLPYVADAAETAESYDKKFEESMKSPEFQKKVQQKIMMFASNGQLPIAERDGEAGILVLDEITSAAMEVQAAALQLLDVSRGVGNYKLPPKWLVVSLGNGEGDGGVYRQLPSAYVNRCMSFRVTASSDAWITWAMKNSVHPTVLAFIRQNPTSLHVLPRTSDSEYVDDNTQFPSPRSWTAVSYLLQNNAEFGYDADDIELEEDFAGNIGNDMAIKFSSFYKYGESLMDVHKILDGTAPSDGKIFSGQGGVERQYIMEQSLISCLRDIIQTDLKTAGVNCDFLTNVGVKLTPDQAIDYTEGLSEDTKAKLNNTINWFTDLNKIGNNAIDADSARFTDVLVAFLTDASRAIPEIFKTYIMSVDSDDVPNIDGLIAVYRSITTF